MGGTIVVVASDGKGGFVRANAIEAVALTDKTVNDFAGPLLPYSIETLRSLTSWFRRLIRLRRLRKSAFTLFTEDATTHLRQPVNGLVASGTPLVIAFKTNNSQIYKSADCKNQQHVISPRRTDAATVAG